VVACQGGNGSDNGGVPVEHCGGIGIAEAERLSDDRHGQRARQAAPGIGGAGGPHRRHQAVSFGHHERGQPGMNLPTAEPARERSPVTAVFRTVERQHARPDYLGGREPGVVNRERRAVTHHSHCEVVPGDQPAVQGGKPRDGLAVPQARQPRMRIAVKIGQSDGLSHRKPATIRHGRSLSVLVTEGDSADATSPGSAAR
jgi:hypothetical protein